MPAIHRNVAGMARSYNTTLPHRQLTNRHHGVTLVTLLQGDRHGSHHHTETT